jgi:hypothetical protein
MPKFVIEREIAGAGKLSAEELQAVSRKARKVVSDPASDVQWLYSFVTEDKTYCVYIAPDEEVLRRRSELAGFPTNRVSHVTSVIDPTTAE